MKSLLTISALGIIAIAGAQNFAVKTAKPIRLSESALSAAEKKTAGTVSADKKTLTLRGKSAYIVVRTGPENDMLSYRVKGVRNPTISVPIGATITILFVNTDDDMYHNFRITAKRPPFAAKVGNSGSQGSADLPFEDKEMATGQELTFVAPAKKGVYSYYCSIKGHAAAGMYGKLIVR